MPICISYKVPLLSTLQTDKMETVTVSKIPVENIEFKSNKKEISQHVNFVKYLTPTSFWSFWNTFWLKINKRVEAYSEHWQQSQIELFAKIVNGFQPLIIFTKSSILDVWQGSEYASGVSGFILFSFLILSSHTFFLNTSSPSLLALEHHVLIYQKITLKPNVDSNPGDTSIKCPRLMFQLN